jgi:type I restriction enzyme R subunit
MISGALAESTVESAALAWLESLGWEVKHGSEIAPGEFLAERADYEQVFLERWLRDALTRLNPTLPGEALEDAFRQLTHSEGATLETRNRHFHRMLTEGVAVEYRREDGSIGGAQARVIDFENPENNEWLAVNQFTVCENGHERRPDLALFVNGLPLALIELKNPADEDATIWTAFRQFETYHVELPTLFAFNELLVISDGLEARIGTLTAGREWFKPWWTISGESVEDTHTRQLEVLLKGVFEKHRLLGLLRDFIVFEDDGSGALAKKMAGYHQFHAVRAAVAETLRAAALQTGGYSEIQPRGGKPGRPAHWRGVAHARLRQEPDHGVLREPHHPRASDGQPDSGGAD